jgi:hypothetical protein
MYPTAKNALTITASNAPVNAERVVIEYGKKIRNLKSGTYIKILIFARRQDENSFLCNQQPVVMKVKILMAAN